MQGEAGGRWAGPVERGWVGDRGAMPEAGLLERGGTPLPWGPTFRLPLEALLAGRA